MLSITFNLSAQGIVKLNGDYIKKNNVNSSIHLKRNSKILFQIDSLSINNIPVILNFSKECSVKSKFDWIILNDSIAVMINFGEGVQFGDKISLYKTLVYKKTENIWSPIFFGSWSDLILMQRGYSPFKITFSNYAVSVTPIRYSGKIFPIAN